MACCFNVLQRYAFYQNRLLGKEVDQQAVRAIKRQYVSGSLLYAVAFRLAWLNSPTSILFQFMLAFFFPLPGYPLRVGAQKERTQISDLADLHPPTHPNSHFSHGSQ